MFVVQHDCQEFLALLLDSLHEQLKHNSLRNQLHSAFSSHKTISQVAKASENRISIVIQMSFKFNCCNFLA